MRGEKGKYKIDKYLDKEDWLMIKKGLEKYKEHGNLNMNGIAKLNRILNVIQGELYLQSPEKRK